MHVEVAAVAGSGRDGGVLPAAVGRAVVGRAGRTGRAAAEGAGRPGAAAADVPGGLPPRRRGLRVRPHRRVRPDPADDQPPPEGAARGGPAGPGQARRVGLLPGPHPGAGQPRHAHRDRIALTDVTWPAIWGQRTASADRASEHGGAAAAGPAPGLAAAGGDRCEAAGPVPVPADWLRLARIARMLSWLTLAWMGVEGGGPSPQRCSPGRWRC